MRDHEACGQAFLVVKASMAAHTWLCLVPYELQIQCGKLQVATLFLVLVTLASTSYLNVGVEFVVVSGARANNLLHRLVATLL